MLVQMTEVGEESDRITKTSLAVVDIVKIAPEDKLIATKSLIRPRMAVVIDGTTVLVATTSISMISAVYKKNRVCVAEG